jgi:hypothetical protein
MTSLGLIKLYSKSFAKNFIIISKNVGFVNSTDYRNKNFPSGLLTF